MLFDETSCEVPNVSEQLSLKKSCRLNALYYAI